MAKFTDPLGQPFRLPEAILNMISECSPQGFMLFYINSNGECDFRADFESDVVERGLRSYITNFVHSVNTAEDICNTQEILNSDNPPPDFNPESETEEED